VLEQPRVPHPMLMRAQPALECGSLLPLWLEPACWLGFVLESKLPRTSSRGGKRQQAAALQSFASTPHMM
jgi:hypothetical protein